MPDPPEVNLFTRFVLENPYPLAALLGIAAVVAVWIGLRDGRARPLQVAGVLVLLAAATVVTGMLVTTPAEHARAVTRQLVDAAVAGQVNQAMNLFAPEATLAIGSPQNPGFDVNFIARQLRQLDQRYAIRSNRITRLRGFTESAERATVHLSCSTEVEGWSGATPSQWVLWVEKQPDGSWKITRLTAISIAGRTPAAQLW